MVFIDLINLATGEPVTAGNICYYEGEKCIVLNVYKSTSELRIAKYNRTFKYREILTVPAKDCGIQVCKRIDLPLLAITLGVIALEGWFAYELIQALM